MAEGLKEQCKKVGISLFPLFSLLVGTDIRYFLSSLWSGVATAVIRRRCDKTATCLRRRDRSLTTASVNREAEAAKKAEQARKKAERDAMLAEEEKNNPGRSAPKNSKAAQKKTRGLDLSQLDDNSGLAALNASGIDNALDALSLTASGSDGKVDRHPERRFKAAYAAYEERRLSEMEADGTGQGLRLNQRKEKIKKEFEKSPENPFNQVSARYDATKEELAQIKAQEKAKIEQRLGSK